MYSELKPTHPGLVAGIMSVLEVLPKTKTGYLSAPITGGKRRYGDFPDTAKALNVADANNAIKLLPEGTINPVTFSAPGLDWYDYMYIWSRVIMDRVNKIYFMPGWEYSDGCSYEYYLGFLCGIPMVEVGSEIPLTLECARAKLGVSLTKKRYTQVRNEVYFLLMEEELRVASLV